MHHDVSSGEALIIAVILLCVSIWTGTWFAERLSKKIEPIPEPTDEQENWFICIGNADFARKIEAGAELCWRMSRKIGLSDKEQKAYQLAAGQIEAAVSLIKKAGQ